MRLEGTGKRLTIYCGENDRHGHHSLAKELVERARDQGLAGATMTRGIEGYGAGSRVHTNRILSLSEDLPIVIQIVDRADRIEAFLPVVDQLMVEGLVTLEDVEVHFYRGVTPPPPHDDPMDSGQAGSGDDR